MRLYHFLSRKYGLLALQQRRLKIARISELNDPFEFLGWNLRDKDVRASIRKWKNDRDREVGIVCFSRKWSNPLLWGHYAEKHHGIVIGFDVPDDSGAYHPVKYREERLSVPANRVLAEADLDDLLLTKFTAWRYESEYRCFSRLADSVQEGGLYFERFTDRLRPAEVIVGDRSTISRAELAETLGDLQPQITVYKARPAFGTFNVVRNRNAALWR